MFKNELIVNFVRTDRRDRETVDLSLDMAMPGRAGRNSLHALSGVVQKNDAVTSNIISSDTSIECG